MKIIFTSVMSLVLIFSALGQSSKTAQASGQSIPAQWHADKPSTKGATIFSEDFASGIPSSWTNVTVSGPVDWKYTTVGHTGDYPTAALLSTSSNNGWVLVDSDADNFSGGGLEDAHLTTPIIDCSSFANIKVEFQQMFRRWQQDITTVRVTTDGGANFTDFVINSSITQAGTDNPDYVNIDITSAISGDPTNVQVVFWWQGAWDYGWQIDDVSIKEIDPNDNIIKKASLSEDVTYYQVPETEIQPLSFNAFIENIGYLDQTNVELIVDVDFGGSSVFNGVSNSLATLYVGTSDSLYLTNTYTPTSVGNYQVLFTADQSETEDNPSNNSTTLSFTITDTIYAIDNDTYGGQWWNLDDGAGSSNPFEIGAVYEIVANDDATSASVFVGDNSVDGAIFELNIYSYDATSDSYNFLETTETYTITSSDLGNWVTIPFQNIVSLSAGTDYLVSLIHYGGTDAVYVGYGTNTSFRGATLSNDGVGGAWSTQPRTPMIRLNLGATDLAVEDRNQVSIPMYPNPTNGMVTVDVSSVLGAYSIEVMDVQGKLIERMVNMNQIDLSRLEQGSYLIKVISEELEVIQKVIKF